MSLLLYNSVLVVLVSTIREKKEIKDFKVVNIGRWYNFPYRKY